MTRPDLAATLRSLSESPELAMQRFYFGQIGIDIVADINENGDYLLFNQACIDATCSIKYIYCTSCIGATIQES